MSSPTPPMSQAHGKSRTIPAAAVAAFLAFQAPFDATLAGAQAPDPAQGSTLAATAPDSSRASPNTAHKPPRVTMAVVDQPRATGYFVGDKVTQRVLLDTNGQPLSPVTLPKPGRVSAWFERRAANIQTDAASRRWLVVEYQILNAPPKLITARLPSWSLPVKGITGATSAALAVPPAKVNIAPLSLPGTPTQVGTSDLRPDHLPPVIETAPIRRAMETSVGAMLLTLIAWLTWIVWRNRRALATQPFANALREMRALDDREPRAWQALHRAFDRTAGRVIQSATLPVLFERAPQLIPIRGEIEQFFAQSSRLFFSTAPASVPPAHGVRATAIPGPAAPTAAPNPRSAIGPSPRALCLELRSIEKRHER